MNRLLTTTASLLCSSALAPGALIAFTSFENETVAAQYVDTGDPAVDHDLLNNPGESPVDSTITSELGYDASYVNTRNSVGLTDGDFVGVTDFLGTVGAFTEGSQGYQFSDTDGQMVLTFDPVPLGAFTGVTVSLDYWVAESGWETTAPSPDSITIMVMTDVGTFPILDTTGSDIDDLSIEGSWIQGMVSIPDTATNAQLVVTLDSNSAAEALFIDNVKINGIPEPSSAFLSGLALLFLLQRRKTLRGTEGR